MNPETYPDKKQRLSGVELFDEVGDILQQVRELEGRFEIGQREATWVVLPEYPQLPILVDMMTDTHWGSSKVDVALLRHHLDVITHPQWYFVHNGDHVDNFNSTGKWASGMMENPLPPQTVSRSWCGIMEKMDRASKIGVLSFGNHDDFGLNAGQDWYDSFLSEIQAPIFTSGGLLHILVGNQHYKLALTHRYWGTSKKNPTNACKNFLDFEHNDADIVFLGHTHQSEGLYFEKGGKKRIGVIGGTFKDNDTFARKHGIGGRSGSPGYVVALWPNERRLQLFNDVDTADDFIKTQIYRLTQQPDWVDPYTQIGRGQDGEGI